MVNFLSQ